MKLENVLDNLNSFEKTGFLKVINQILSSNPKNQKEIDKILSESSRDLKSMDNINISKVFKLVEEEYAQVIHEEFNSAANQLDILIDIIIRDGNCLMKEDWFSRLYEAELKHLKSKTKSLRELFSEKPKEGETSRGRDYRIYYSCLNTAYTNDDANNQERRISGDENSVLLTLSRQLSLSQEEAKLINYMILPVQSKPIEEVVKNLKDIGVLFFSKKFNTVYVADEVVRVLRRIRGKEVADKFFRRILKQFRESQINLICKRHNIDWRLPIDKKIKEIINEGLSFSGVLTNDVHKEGTNLTDKKKFFNELTEKGLKIHPSLKGTTLDDKIANLVKHFDAVEKDEKVGISVDGYEKLAIDLGEQNKRINRSLKEEYELQDENVLNSSLLLDYNIKPRDVLEMLSHQELKEFCGAQDISTRGDEIINILEAYKDNDNLYLENYVNIGFRDFRALKENGIKIKESELGIKFEDLTKAIFSQLGFNVDETVRKALNTKKDKMDIVLNLGNNDLIIVECKTSKESGYNKFSSVSRQLKAYSKQAKANDFSVIKSLLIAPDFSDDFVNDCELEYDLNLSLISANSMVQILDGLKKSKMKVLPYKLLMRDVVIQHERIIKAIK